MPSFSSVDQTVRSGSGTDTHLWNTFLAGANGRPTPGATSSPTRDRSSFTTRPDSVDRLVVELDRPRRADPDAREAGMSRVDRGDLYWLAVADGDEPAPGSTHPHVVVQDDVFNHSRIARVVVCALTTNLHRATRERAPRPR
jgi:hypothetical protein